MSYIVRSHLCLCHRILTHAAHTVIYYIAMSCAHIPFTLRLPLLTLRFSLRSRLRLKFLPFGLLQVAHYVSGLCEDISDLSCFTLQINQLPCRRVLEAVRFSGELEAISPSCSAGHTALLNSFVVRPLRIFQCPRLRKLRYVAWVGSCTLKSTEPGCSITSIEYHLLGRYRSAQSSPRGRAD